MLSQTFRLHTSAAISSRLHAAWRVFVTTAAAAQPAAGSWRDDADPQQVTIRPIARRTLAYRIAEVRPKRAA